MKINDRILEMEKKVVKLDYKDTKIDWNSLSPEEQKLFDRLYSLKDKAEKDTISKTESDEYQKLLKKASQIIWMRVRYMFINTLLINCQMICGEDPEIELDLNFRLLWFVDQIIREAIRIKEEKSLKNKNQDSERTIEDNVPLWSEESFRKYLEKVLQLHRERS